MAVLCADLASVVDREQLWRIASLGKQVLDVGGHTVPPNTPVSKKRPVSSDGANASGQPQPRDPLAPRKLQQPVQLGATLESEVIRDAAVGGETIYVATDDHGLAIVDASNNEDLRAVGYYREGESVQAVSVQGRQAYISYADRIEMLDISDGQRVKLQRSANLVDWEDWQTMTLGGNATGCGLIDATTATPQRFYRAVEGMPRPTDEP